MLFRSDWFFVIAEPVTGIGISNGQHTVFGSGFNAADDILACFDYKLVCRIACKDKADIVKKFNLSEILNIPGLLCDRTAVRNAHTAILGTPVKQPCHDD